MALPLEQFVRQLEETGILAANTLGDFLPPKRDPKDADALVLELVNQKVLTPFQAEEVRRGNGSALVIDNYVVLEKIGAGGMGQVFRARHKRLGRIVALKLLSPGIVKNEGTVARFQREVRAAAKLSHPNIVAAYDAGCAKDVHFLVMEYVPGSDLAALVKKNGPCPLPQTLNYVLQAARGLAAAHADGIIHRDIKPANLLLDETGTVKILDMGLARLQEDESGQAELTSTGAVMGTVDYMAPEQALNTKTADARADVYSLGCTLYYLLTGKPAYSGDTLMARLLAHREISIPSLTALSPDVPEAVDAVFQKMLAKSMVDRYQTMGELVADLERLARGKSATVKSQPASASAGNSELAGLWNDITATAAVKTRPGRSGSAHGNRRSNRAWLFVGAGVLCAAILVAGIVISLRTKEGTLILRVNEPDAKIEVLSEAGNVEVTRQGERGMLTIPLDPGKHRLRVTKEGFDIFTQEFTIASGGKEAIAAKLVSAEDEEPDQIHLGDLKFRYTAPGFKEWMEQVAALPAVQQMEAVAASLEEYNPGFEGSVTPKVEDGTVTELILISDVVTDLSPVRALTKLKRLTCNGTDRNRFASLSPLRGMPLQEIWLGPSQVDDLSPLRGMPLELLRLDSCRVSDLSPLKGMPLHFLEIHCGLVSDLSPLEGMPLKSLDVRATAVADLSPLASLPLTTFDCRETRVADLSPLKTTTFEHILCNFQPGRDAEILQSIKTLKAINNKAVADFWKDLPALKQLEEVLARLKERNPGFDGKVADQQIVNGVLVHLALASVAITDLSPVRELTGLTSFRAEATGSNPSRLTDLSPLKDLPLKILGLARIPDLTPLQGMPLEAFYGDGNPIVDLGPLRGKPIKTLYLEWTTISDLSPLAGMPLEELWMAGCEKVKDLSPLKGAPLRMLRCVGTQVSDLSPLKGMPLTHLECFQTKIKDLTPLAGMPLKHLNCTDTAITDFSPLADVPLESIYLDFVAERDSKVLRSMKSLKQINGRPVADFWKAVDAAASE